MLKSNHNKSTFFSLTVLVMIGLMASCKSVNISSEAPEKELPTVPNFVLAPSVINVPVSFSVTQIESRVNQELNGVIYRDDNIEDDNYKMIITKTGTIKVNADNNKVSFTIPLHIDVTGRWKQELCSICPKVDMQRSSSFDIVVKTQSTVALTENWQVKTETTGDYDWGNQRPSLDIGPISIPLSSVIDLALRPQMNRISARFDQEIHNRINIKDYVQKAWVTAQQPILVDNIYNTWLVMSPMEVSATSLQANAGKLFATIGIKALIETVSGNMPHPVINTTLPKLTTHNGTNDDFNIGLSGEITYALASDILKKQIQGQTYHFDDNKYEMTVDSIELTGNADYVLIRMDLAGKQQKGGKKKINGRVYMQGVPYYDPADMSIKVKDLKYSVKSKNVLLKSASWLLKAGFENQLNKYMVFPVKDRLEEARKMVENSINSGYKINDYATLKGNLKTLEPQGIYLTPNSLKAYVNAKGKISIILDKM
jgi:hypothetical protein